MEKDDEIKNEGNSYDFGARLYDPRVGRWLSVDPLAKKYPGWTPYKSMLNNPLINIDPGGETEYKVFIVFNEQTGENTLTMVTANSIMTDGKKHFSGSSATWSHVNKYYDYATVMAVNIAEDGTTTMTTFTKILYENGSKDADYVWFGGDGNGDTKEETWMTGPDHGRKVRFGIAISGDGQSNTNAMDWTDNILGDIEFSFLSSVLKRSAISTKGGYRPGQFSLKKAKPGNLGSWFKSLNQAKKTGEKIGETVESIWDKVSKEESESDSVDVEISCGGASYRVETRRQSVESQERGEGPSSTNSRHINYK